MKTIVELDTGERWVILENQEEADEEGRLSETAVGLYFKHENSYASLDGTEAPVYYSLRSENNARSLVSGRILRREGERNPLMFVCYRNASPFPEHADAMAALGRELGIDLGPHAYPYGRRSGSEDNALEDRGLGDHSSDSLLEELRSRGLVISDWSPADGLSTLECDESLPEMSDEQLDQAARLLLQAAARRLQDVLGERGGRVMDEEWEDQREAILAEVFTTASIPAA